MICSTRYPRLTNAQLAGEHGRRPEDVESSTYLISSVIGSPWVGRLQAKREAKQGGSGL